MDPTLTIVIIVICVRLAGLGALALRLRFRTRHQRQQNQIVVTLASQLPPGTLLELDDRNADGTRLRLWAHAEQYSQERHARA